MPDFYNNPSQIPELVDAIPSPWIVEEDLVKVDADNTDAVVSEVTFGFPISAASGVDGVKLRDQLYKAKAMSTLREHFETADPPIHLTQTSFVQHATPVLGETIAEIGFATRWPIPETFDQTLNGAREIIGDIMLRACTDESSWREELAQIQSLETVA